MGLKISQIKEVKDDFSNLKIPKENNGLKLSDLQSMPKKINIFNYIDNKPTDISDAYVCDLETYRHNSRIRTIQLYDIKEKTIHLFINGDIEDKHNILNNQKLKEHGFKIELHIYGKEIKDIVRNNPNYLALSLGKKTLKDSEIIIKDKKVPIKFIGDGIVNNDFTERLMFYEFIEFIKKNPKVILGHNFCHFDIGIIGALIQEFGIKGFKIFEYSVGGARGIRRVAFSYSVIDEPYQNWWKDTERYNLIDTMMIAQSLQLKSSALKYLSKDTRFEKKDVEWWVFQNDVLKSEWLEYGVYDVIAIPEVLENLRAMWSYAINKLKIQFKQSQRCVEHVLMKGAGAIAESYLSYLLNGQISLDTKDHLSKYYGGITRAWKTELYKANNKKQIRYFDFTSFYPFSIRKQKIFDVMNGSCERLSNIDYKDVKDRYDDLLYSAVFEVEAVKDTNVIIESELEKNNQQHIGVGFFRSFDKEKRIADLEHQFCFVSMKKGDKVKLTKTEYEISKALNPNTKIKIIKLIDGIIATSKERSEEYIQLYKERKRLKKDKNSAEVGYKILLNASYGKIAESRGRWFNLACSSAITGYCRTHLIKTILHARKYNLDVLYSDTDSLYMYGDVNQMGAVQKYAESFNEHPIRFGENNLKDEGENIVCFWGVKRKRYLKVIKENDKNNIVIKGVNGNRDIGWRDVYYRISSIVGGCLDIQEINKRIQNNKFELKQPNKIEFEESCKKIYENNLNKKISSLFPVSSNATISMMIGIHFKRATTYEDGIYYHHIVKSWEKETRRKAWIGCFFSINRDYTFTEKKADDFNKWSMEYRSYESKEDKIPAIKSDKYNELVNKQINLDTIRIKTREPIKLDSLSKDDKTSITFKTMGLKRSSQSNRVLDIFGQVFIYRLQLTEDLDPENYKILKKGESVKDKEIYSNATLFLKGLHQMEGALRIQKTHMFVKKRDIFSIYRFVSDLGIFTQKLVLNLLKQETKLKGKPMQPLELNAFPRFTFVTQADVYQPVTAEYHEKIYHSTYKTIFHRSTLNDFYNYKLLSYCELNIYNKPYSATGKLKRKIMQEFERDTFLHEISEGEYRSEVKFKLKRNYYETLSYIFMLGNIKQDFFLDIVSSKTKEEFDKRFKHIRKKYCFEFPSKLKGYFQFNQQKCIILIEIQQQTTQSEFYNIEYREYNGNIETNPLENRGFSDVSYPPNNKFEKNNVVRWEWEEDKMVQKDEIEENELEVMGFK